MKSKSTPKPNKFGWIRDLPDIRDLKLSLPSRMTLPESVDLRKSCPEVYNQGEIGSCTANGIAFALQFDMMKQKKPHVFIPSRLFIYYNERVMEGTVRVDTGASIRNGVKSVYKQGACPENIWPYDQKKFRTKPPKMAYKAALLNQAVEYRHVAQTLYQLKACLASGFPFVFGIMVYESFDSNTVARSGIVYMPSMNEHALGGHCITAVGYDDKDSRFICRNSWGPNWGKKGYFTIPYNYVLENQLASDFWVITEVE